MFNHVVSYIAFKKEVGIDYICDWICNTRTMALQNTNFTTNLWMHRQSIHVYMFRGQQFTSLLFLRLFSETCQMSMNACPVCTQSSLLAVQQRLPGCEVSYDLVVILSTDLTTFWTILKVNCRGKFTLCLIA